MNNYTFQIIDEGNCALITYDGNDEEIVIPDRYDGLTISMLADSLFQGHSEIRTVKLPKGLKYIGSRIFDGCEKLKSLHIPDTLEDMDQYAFTGSGLEILEIPGSVRNIIPYTFKDCTSLNTIVIRKGVRKIHPYAFEGCINLELVAVPSDTEISHDAFKGCIKLNPRLTRRLVSSCRCPACTGAAKKEYPAKNIVTEYLNRKTGQL